MSDRRGFGEDVRPEFGEPPSVMQLIGQLFMLPVAVMVYGVEMLVRSMRGMQEAANRGMEVVVGGGSDFAPAANRVTPAEPEGEQAQSSHFQNAETGISDAANTQKEEKTLSNDGGIIALDKDLHDDMLKLVRYKILFVKREYEVAFPEQEDLVSDNMDGSAFAAWKVAEFIQHLGKKTTAVPVKWGARYPDEHRDLYVTKENNNEWLTALPDKDKKYLRVYYEVLDRYPREKFKYEERQIEVLKEIRDKLPAP